MGLFSTKIEEEIVAVLDISSGGVSGAIVLKNSKKLPFVLATATKNFRIRDNVEASRLQKDMLEALDYVCTELQKSTRALPSKIYCVPATPWSHGELRLIHLVREKEFQFTEIFAQKLITEEISKFQKESSDRGQIIDKKITRVSLNGYVVKSPHGQKTSSLELDVFLSVCSIDLVKKIEDKVHKTFKSKIFFTSQMLADFVFARDLFSASMDFLTLNVGAEFTEVTLSRSGSMFGTAFFPYGSSSIIRTMSEKLQKSENVVESLFRLYKDNALDKDSESLIEDAASFATDMWISAFKQVLLEILPNRHMPSSIFLTVRGDASSWFGSKLTRENIPEFTTEKLDFDVIIVDTRLLHDFYDKAENTQPNTNILIKAIYINQI